MSRIYICGLDNMPDGIERLRPGRLISLLPREEQPPTPYQISPSDHLRLEIDDIDQAVDGPTVPGRTHIATLITFLRASPPSRSLLIHCLAGISRSPAAALIAMVTDAPGREFEAASILRSAAPYADPNRLMIQLADEFLERGGRLVSALDSMGSADMSIDLTIVSLPWTV